MPEAKHPGTPAERVAYAIENSGKTMEHLAAEMGCTHATLSQWKTGATNVLNAKAQLLTTQRDLWRARYDVVFSGLKLRRGSEFYDFAELSGGMREQLTAALRLSMADVLKQAHDGCLPLVFDDAFANADPSRIALVTAMLEEAVARGLQVILLTCDPAQYGDLGAATIDLAAAAG